MSQQGGAGSPPDADQGFESEGRRRRVRPEVGASAAGSGRTRRARPSIARAGRRRRRAARGARSRSQEPGGESHQTEAVASELDTAEPAADEPSTAEPAADAASTAEAPAAGEPAFGDEPRPPGREDAAAASQHDTAARAPQASTPRWWEHPVLRVGAYAWALIGIGAVAWAISVAAGALQVVVIPVLLALFPAALLYPAVQALRRMGLPAGLASLATMLGVLLLLIGLGTALVPQVANEVPEMTESAQQGMQQVETFLDESAPFGVSAAEARTRINEFAEGLDFQAVMDVVRAGALGAAAAVAEIILIVVLLVVVLFFYLKDGERLGRWLCGLFPASVREDAEVVGLRAWMTIGSYFRGQLLVAFIDAVGIGLGLLLLGVPLALPLSVLVFFGGLFPIVGAVVTGALAVLVALATNGPVVALAVLGIAVAVQQLESNVMAPYVLGRATALHPLAVLTVITAGGLLLGVLGAFLAVPVAASVVQGVAALRGRRRGRNHSIPAVTGQPEPAPTAAGAPGGPRR
ncbi:MAG: hypothetical protein BRC32_03535 [Actinobacteria bacterium QS_8_72_14]|nr:MAG: hypothetical protein BRC32_03535 [Actinobacteria bacterium QS_8_72_14]